MQNSIGKLGKYELIERLDDATSGIVYKAFQPGVERFVAIKVLPQSFSQEPAFVERFRRQARTLGQLQHTNLVRVIDFDVQDDQYFMIMPYILGGTLHDYLQKNGPLPVDIALKIALQLTDGLAYAHQQGMIHHEIKPVNIMFTDEGLSSVVLTDFGLADMLRQANISHSELIGTPAYMAPEILRGEKGNEQSDIYSLAVVLYEMLIGSPPYTASTPDAILLILANEPLPSLRHALPDLPQEVELLIRKGLAKEPAKRFKDANQFYKALHHALARLTDAPQSNEEASDGASEHGGDGAAKPKTSAPFSLMGAIVAISLIILLSVIVAMRLDRSEPSQPNHSPSLSEQVEKVKAGQISNPKPVGFLRFGDNQYTRAGDISLEIDSISPPEQGYHYELWLVGNSSPEQKRLDLGALTVNQEPFTFTSSTKEDLIAHYDQVLISIEANNETSQAISDQIAFRGSLPLELLTPLRSVIFQDKIIQKAFLLGASEQVRQAYKQAELLQETLKNDDLVTAKYHVEDIINILNGENGPNFDDFDSDGKINNSGDGFGVLPYLEQAHEQIEQAKPYSAESERAEQFIKAIINAQVEVTNAEQIALKLLTIDSSVEGFALAEQMIKSLEASLDGKDFDGNGQIDWPADEGAMRAAYDFALLMAEIPIFSTNTQ